MTEHTRANRRSAAVFLIFTVAVTLSMAGYVVIGLFTAQDRAGRAFPPTPVTTAVVAPMEFARIIEAVGTARANESVALTAKVTDTLSELKFDSGAVVREGDVIAALTDAQETAELEEALSSLREARLDFERAQDLLRRRVAAQARLDTARAALEQAEARVTGVKARLEDRLIVAPFDGVLGLRILSQGALVQPGDVVATLDDTSVIKVDFSVPEVFLGAISVGQTVDTRTPAFASETFPGEVASVDNRVDPATRTVTVRALIDNADGRLRAGMLLGVDLVQDRRDALSVPEAAVLRTQSTAYVFVVVDDGDGAMRAERRQITLGARRPGFIEAAEGLAAGERVVVDGVHRVRDKRAVEPVGLTDTSEDDRAAAISSR